MWRIENQCPQCGADTCLEETQRLFTCPFCRVKLFITVDDYFRYFLSPTAPGTEEAIFVPYWRLKGMFFSYDGASVHTGLVDVSHNAAMLDFLPSSLGLRSQTLRLRFVSPEIRGSFIEPACSPGDILSTIEDPFNPETPLLSEKTFVGESVSMIFSPIYVKDRAAYDGILREKMAVLPEAVSGALIGNRGKAKGTMSFIPSLCPDCGWDMDGDPESVVLTCGNCRSAWGASRKGFEKVPCSFLPLERRLSPVPALLENGSGDKRNSAGLLRRCCPILQLAEGHKEGMGGTSFLLVDAGLQDQSGALSEDITADDVSGNHSFPEKRSSRWFPLSGDAAFERVLLKPCE